MAVDDYREPDEGPDPLDPTPERRAEMNRKAAATRAVQAEVCDNLTGEAEPGGVCRGLHPVLAGCGEAGRV